MKIKEKLECLLTYYHYNRKVGNTTLLKEGTKKYEGEKFILSFSKEDSGYLGCKSSEIITFRNDGIRGLIGNNKPLAIDNSVMSTMLEESLAYINELEEYKERYDKIKQFIK